MSAFSFFPIVRQSLKSFSLFLPLVGALGAGAALADTASFNTPGATTWTVPAGVTSLSVVAKGGGGGAFGGNGAIVTVTLPVTPGQVFNLYVGGGGGQGSSGNGTGGLGGGGIGGPAVGGGGGGATTVNASSSNQIIAGGGGGGGFNSNSARGGDGGTPVGSNGSNQSLASYVGTGGSNGIGGNGGADLMWGAGGNGTSTNGGAGSFDGGGGGGGYGGGGGGSFDGGGGGGGSVGPAGAAYSLATNGGTSLSSNGGNGSIVFTYAVTASTPLISPLATAPTVSGVGSQPSVVDLSTYSGPKMVNCLLTAIQQMTGLTGTYQGQQTSGAATISLSNGTKLSFYPLSASAATGLGLAFTGTNAMNVATTCGTFNTAPAAYSLTELGNAINTLASMVQIDANGAMTATIGGQTFVVRPDYYVTSGGGRNGLVRNADGTYGMNYADGSVQLLRPAFVDPTTLQNDATTMLLGQLSIQMDGTAIFTLLNGSQMTWTPEYLLTPSSLTSTPFVNDATNHYKYRVGASYQGMSSR